MGGVGGPVLNDEMRNVEQRINLTMKSKIKSQSRFQNYIPGNWLFVLASCSFFPLSCTFFYRIKRFIFSPSLIPSPSWSPLMKDRLETMPVLSGLGVNAWFVFPKCQPQQLIPDP